MGYSYRRVGVKGKPRYAAIYHDQRGRRRSAGTFATKREADHAWAAAESDALLGVGRDRQRGKISFAAYVTGTWLPHHQLEASTRQRYGYQIDKYLLPEFGPMRIANIAPAHVREWVTRLKDQGVSASTIADVKTILSAIFTTALNDQLIGVHPCRGVKTPTVARRPRTIVTPDQFDAIHTAIGTRRWQLFIELDIETGLRWGELTELRVHDVNPATRMLTVARAVAEINTRFRQPGEPRFAVNAYPKDKEYRRIKLSPEIAAALTDHITREQLDRDDLLFTLPRQTTEPDEPRDSSGRDNPDHETVDLGMTEPNPTAAATRMAPSPATTSAPAAAGTAAPPPPATAPPAAPPAKTTPARPQHRHRRTHPPPLVRRQRVEPRPRRRRTRVPRPRTRPTPRPRLLAARRRRRHPNRQRTPRPRQPAHHREIPPHPPRRRRHRPRRATPHTYPCDAVGLGSSRCRDINTYLVRFGHTLQGGDQDVDRAGRG